jgi:Flp pilus assembly protein TadD
MKKKEASMTTTAPMLRPSLAPQAGDLLQDGIALANCGALEEADALLRRAIELAPGSAEAWLWLGWTAVRQGNRQAAKHYFVEAQRLGHPRASQALQLVSPERS